jgi:multiple sugar transport system substrate-binding protein
MTDVLKGVTFSHPRIVQPLLAASAMFAEKEPGTVIEWTEHSLQDFEELSLCKISERFDVFAYDHPLIGDAVGQGCVVDLEEARPGMIARLRQSSLGLCTESYVVGNKLLGVPFDGAVQSSAWVTARFSNGGPPLQLTDLIAFAADDGRESVALPLLPAHAGCTFLTLAASVSELGPEERRFYLDASRIRGALASLKVLIDHSSPRSVDLDPINILDEMSSGGPVQYSPILFGYGTYASSVLNVHPLSFGRAISVGGLPSQALLGGAGIGVSENSKYREKAIDFAEFVTSDPVVHKAIRENRGQSGLKTGWQSSVDVAMDKNFFDATRDAMATGIVRPRFAGFVSFLHELGEAVVHMVQTETPPEQAAHSIGLLFTERCLTDPLLEAIVASGKSSEYHQAFAHAPRFPVGDLPEGKMEVTAFD